MFPLFFVILFRNFFLTELVIEIQKVYCKNGKEKMRTGITLKIITIVLIALALMSATAFAYVGKPAAATGISFEFLWE